MEANSDRHFDSMMQKHGLAVETLASDSLQITVVYEPVINRLTAASAVLKPLHQLSTAPVLSLKSRSKSNDRQEKGQTGKFI